MMVALIIRLKRRIFRSRKQQKGAKIPNLKQARKGKIEDFIKEHEADPDDDLDKLDALIKRLTQGSEKATRPASPQESSDD